MLEGRRVDSFEGQAQMSARGTPKADGKRLNLQGYAYDDARAEATSDPIPTTNLGLGRGPATRKRKRDLVATPQSIELFDSTATRRSPRKTPAVQDEISTTRKPRRQPAKRFKGPNGSDQTKPPSNWLHVYETCAAMRKRITAPVDTMGCESLAEESRSPRDQRLQTLVSLMLSSQTKDTVTAAAIRNLQQSLTGGLTLDSLLAVEPADLNKLIEKVGFHNNKTKYIKAMAIVLRDQFNGDIPDTAEGLISLPGVGPKMAYLCLSAAWGRHEGIGVDVHVHRITNLWGWHRTSTPEQTRGELESWLPRDKWHEINHLLVGLGQTICLPIGRKCGDCDLGKENLCPSAVAGSPAKKKVKKEVEIKVEDNVAPEIERVTLQQGDLGIKNEDQALAGAIPNGIKIEGD